MEIPQGIRKAREGLEKWLSVDVQKQLNKDKVHSVQWFEYVKRIKSNHEKSVRKLKALHDMELKARGVEPMALVFASRLHHMYESAQERLVAEDEDEEDDSLYEHQMAFEDLKDAALELEGEIELAQKEKEERDLLMSMEASASVNRSGTSSQPLDDSPDPSPPVRHNSNSRRQSLPLDDTADEAEREREIEAIANRSRALTKSEAEVEFVPSVIPHTRSQTPPEAVNKLSEPGSTMSAPDTYAAMEAAAIAQVASQQQHDPMSARFEGPPQSSNPFDPVDPSVEFSGPTSREAQPDPVSDSVSMTHTWMQKKLGITIQAIKKKGPVGGFEPGCKIQKVNREANPSLPPWIEVGLMVAQIQGEDVRAKSYNDIEMLFKESARPLVVQFMVNPKLRNRKSRKSSRTSTGSREAHIEEPKETQLGSNPFDGPFEGHETAIYTTADAVNMGTKTSSARGRMCGLPSLWQAFFGANETTAVPEVPDFTTVDSGAAKPNL